MSPARAIGWGLAMIVGAVGVGAVVLVLTLIIGVVEAASK